MTIVATASGAILLAAGRTAAAADLSPTTAAPASVIPATVAAPFGWTGFYGGVNAGWGVEHDGGAVLCISPSGVLNGNGCLDDAVGGYIHEGTIAGAQMGYNWQIDKLVFGIESDLQWSNVNGETDVFVINPVTAATNKTFTDNLSHQWFGTLRGRIGVAWDRALFYVSGGLGYARIATTSWMAFQNGTTSTAGGDFLRAGWVAATGIEYALTDTWSVKGEVLWYDLGTITVSSISGPSGPAFIGGKTFDTTTAIYRAGINYRFDWGNQVSK